jgi:hypothetical protein
MILNLTMISVMSMLPATEEERGGLQRAGTMGSFETGITSPSPFTNLQAARASVLVSDYEHDGERTPTAGMSMM